METHTGKIIEINQQEFEDILFPKIPNDDVEDCLKYIEEDNDYYDAICGAKMENELIVIKINGTQRFFKFLEHKKHDEGYMCESTKNTDGSIDFLCSWYNGGAAFSEVLEDALKSHF